MTRQALKETTIRLEVKFFDSGVLFDPISVDSVRIYDSNENGTLLSTLTPVRTDVGLYYADYYIPSSLTSGSYWDEWTWQANVELPFTTQRNKFYVASNVTLSATNTVWPTERRLQLIETRTNTILTQLINFATKKELNALFLVLNRRLATLETNMDNLEALVRSSSNTILVTNHISDINAHLSLFVQKSDVGHTHTDDDSAFTRIDGSRPFTNTIAGVTPLQDSDLSTKSYVDNAIAGFTTTLAGLDDVSLTSTQNNDLLKYSSGLWLNVPASSVGITDHGLLTSLIDDDHLQYILVDGTRAFTGTVGGITPTTTDHLSTKGYVDGLALATTTPLTGAGTLGSSITLGIIQATATTHGYLTSGDWTAFHGHMENPMSQLGDLVYGGTLGVATRLPIGTSSTFLKGETTPAWTAITEADLSLSDITTNNSTSLRHGLLPRLTGSAAQFLDGAGNWTTPAGQSSGYTSSTFSNQTSVTITHNFGAYPVVQVTDTNGAVIIPKTITNTSVNAFTLTFSVPSSGTVLATIGSPQAQSVRIVTDNYTVSGVDRIVKMISASKQVTLTTASGVAGKEFIIDNDSSGNITVSGLEMINNQPYQTLPSDSAIHVYSDGSKWRIY